MEFVTFSSFAAAASARGLTAVKYSGTGYYVKAANGIRVEFQNTRGGVYGVGYTNNAKQVAAVYTALTANPPANLTFIKRLAGSFNYRATNLDDFFGLVEAVGKVALPFTGRGANDAVTVPVAPETANGEVYGPAPAKVKAKAKAKVA